MARLLVTAKGSTYATSRSLADVLASVDFAAAACKEVPTTEGKSCAPRLHSEFQGMSCHSLKITWITKIYQALVPSEIPCTVARREMVPREVARRAEAEGLAPVSGQTPGPEAYPAQRDRRWSGGEKTGPRAGHPSGPPRLRSRVCKRQLDWIEYVGEVRRRSLFW